MKIRYLNGKRLYYAFVNGADRVIQEKEELNRINVFPVPDGDTGSNLAATLENVLFNLRGYGSLKETADAIAEAALEGARGNSGIIFAQFLSGLAEYACHENSYFSVIDFAEAMNSTVYRLYDAVADPVEGTMITVIREWAEKLDELKEETADFRTLFAGAFVRARESLAETPEKLKVLKETGVVDSGARGFVLFLEGIQDFINGGDMNEAVLSREEEPETFHKDYHEPKENITFRYCTEVLVRGEKLEPSVLRNAVASLGDSVITAGTDRVVRVHIHTDAPHKVMAALSSYGKLHGQKADDMLRQYQDVYRRKSPVALVTDSIADLPREIVDGEQIHVIPLNIDIDGSSYLDRLTVKPEMIYAFLDFPGKKVSSSQPNEAAVRNFFEFLLSSGMYCNVLVLSVSSALSGTYSVFCRAAEKFGGRVEVVDTRLNSGAQGLLVAAIARFLNSGGTFSEAVAKSRCLRNRGRIFVSVPTLKYMVRGGRVSAFGGFLGRVFNIRPIVSLDADGAGRAFSVSFSPEGSMKKIGKIFSASVRTKGIDSYAVLYSGDREKAEEAADNFRKISGLAPAYVTEISSIVAMNSGKGAIGLAFLGKEAD